jgi:hypothetical protein
MLLLDGFWPFRLPILRDCVIRIDERVAATWFSGVEWLQLKKIDFTGISEAATSMRTKGHHT